MIKDDQMLWIICLIQVTLTTFALSLVIAHCYSFHFSCLLSHCCTGHPMVAVGGLRGILKVINVAKRIVEQVLVGHGQSINEVCVCSFVCFVFYFVFLINKI